MNPIDNSQAKWYVLKVVTGQEDKVRSYIEAELARERLESSVLQILIPSQKIYEHRNGKKKLRNKQFFPGYILIYADINYGGLHHVISSVPGALGFLSERGWGTSKSPMPLRKSEINRILGNVEESKSNEEDLDLSFLPGENIKITDGPFNGFIGTVQQVMDDRKKLNIIVKVFGRNTPMDLSYNQVEKI